VNERSYRNSPLQKYHQRQNELARGRERTLEDMRQALMLAFGDIDTGPETPAKEPMGRPALVRFHAAKRRTAKLQRTPAWANMNAIKEFYAAAQRMTEAMGEPYHVDHVIPLQGRLVSGLHVHNNLQIIHGSENSKKRNHFEVEA
jgi:hypothetical protein